jgi:putative glutamine amidotransferase
MTGPIIGVTSYQGVNEEGYPIAALQRAYIDSLCQAGGVPIIIPPSLGYDALLLLLNHLNGILFTGGGDIAIDRFGGEPNSHITNVDPDRDALELRIFSYMVKARKPFLGICRGFQLINVGMGGSLFTHIADQKWSPIKHDYYPDYPRIYLAHKVEVKIGTRLARILGETELSVNSLHHQGAKDVPEGLIQSAFAPDGLVEAIELPDFPFGIAVQWHPEWLRDQPSMRRLFKAFVESAKDGQ